MKLRPILCKTVLEQPAFVKGVLEPIWKNFSVNSPVLRRKFSWSRKKSEAGPTVVVPDNCRDILRPIISPECSIAVVIGGSNRGFGFSAAEQLLVNGAKTVILADNELTLGGEAAERLCKAFGRERAKFYPCDLQNSCQVEGIFTSSYCKDDVVTIVFNDFDAIQDQPKTRLNYCDDVVKLSNVQRISRLSVEHMVARCRGRRPGLIVNCASVLGFMGWPEEPMPVYCGVEPVSETTIRMAKEHRLRGTNVRLVALLPSNRSFEEIGLPTDPKKVNCLTDPKTCERIKCVPDPMKDRTRMGRALVHLMAVAESGTAWFLEPPFSIHEVPKLLKLDEQSFNPANLEKKKKVNTAKKQAKVQQKSTCQCN